MVATVEKMMSTQDEILKELREANRLKRQELQELGRRRMEEEQRCPKSPYPSGTHGMDAKDIPGQRKVRIFCPHCDKTFAVNDF